MERAAGALSNLEGKLAEQDGGRFAANSGMGHTRWATHGATVHLHLLDGVPFWDGGPVAECPALLDATSAVFAESS